ncbi:ankyrin repeat-containing domain protein [Hypoxylon rubiginosum]|uniref:Ankyrin repeat-containing domain protein n=1 Tax=Hypoxylon rubiginosum TaxID=110542 RepID=A0ACB9YI73_9PEZI|nr:ankyrin repeat-containing domain protein [Hypoxylon rubiginosum]
MASTVSVPSIASIASAPTEVMLMIFAHLPCRGESTIPYKDLASLSRTSRALHKRINPILYCSNKDKDNSSLVLWAAGSGRVETLEKAFLFKLPLDPENSTGDVSKSTIRLATKKGDRRTVAWLVDHGVKIDRPGPEGASGAYSPLLFALQRRKPSIARLLIDKGASLIFSFKNEFNPLRYKKASRVSAIHVAAEFGLIPVVRYLVERKGLDINEPDDTGRTCLHYAAPRYKDQSIIPALVALGANVNWSGGDTSPLCCAIEEGNSPMAHVLLDAGANANSNSSSGLQPIHLCSRTNLHTTGLQQLSLLKRLIELGADPNARSKGVVQDQTPLAEAVMRGDVEALKVLVRAGADVKARVHGKEPAGLAWELLTATWDQNPYGAVVPHIIQTASPTITYLLRNGARLDSPYDNTGENSNTLLFEAIKHSPRICPYELLDVLLGVASKKNISEGHIDNALAYAVRLRRYSYCQVLLHHGAKLRENQDELVRWVEQILNWRNNNLRQSATLMLNSGPGINKLEMLLDFDLESNRADDLLTMALKHRDEEAVHIFLDRVVAGRYFYYPDPNAWLQEAATWGRTRVLRRVLKALPDVNGFDSDGWLPIARAVKAGHLDATLVLMEHGANALLRTRVPGENFTALEFSLRHSTTEIYDAMLDAQPSLRTGN